MDHGIRIDEIVTMAARNERLEALKARYVQTPNNQQQVGDGDLKKIMNRDLYEATIGGDADIFIDVLEAVSELRELALSLIFDQVTPSGNSLLHVAASSGNDDVVELILVHFPDLVTWENSSGDTPLHVAVQGGRLDATRKLISQRRDSDIIYWKNKDSKSPLCLAVENCKSLDARERNGAGWEILQLLLDASARDEDDAGKIQGMSPVLAIFKDWNSDLLREIVDRLPKLLHVRDENGGTPLHSAASVGNQSAVELLLEKCPDLALQTDKNGSYPIHIACEGRSSNIINSLLRDAWPDLAEIKNNKVQNILHVAAKAGNAKAVSIISQHCNEASFKKLANSKDVDGNTPLHLASMHNHCEVMRFLVSENRSDLELTNNDKLTVLDVALKSQSFSGKDPSVQGCKILINAGVWRSKGRDVRSPREQSSGASKPSHAEWIKDEINTQLLVATLVASVTFTAGFTLPGGYNASSDPHPGMATMLHNRAFQVFVICDTLAMYSSTLAVLILLMGHANNIRVAERAHTSAGFLLFCAFGSMALAFVAAILVAVSKLTWLRTLVWCTAVLYIWLLLNFSSPLICKVEKIFDYYCRVEKISRDLRMRLERAQTRLERAQARAQARLERAQARLERW